MSSINFVKKTLVFFLSDNGGATINSSSNLPLRDFKGSPYEGGLRVPFAARWKGRIPPGQNYLHPVSSLDIMATMAALTQTKIKKGHELDGVNLIPHLTGKNENPPHDRLFWRWADKKRLAVREANRKLIANYKDAKFEMYDLNKDISEKNNLVSANKDLSIVVDLEAAVRQWAEPMKEPAFPGLGSWRPGQESKKTDGKKSP